MTFDAPQRAWSLDSSQIFFDGYKERLFSFGCKSITKPRCPTNPLRCCAKPMPRAQDAIQHLPETEFKYKKRTAAGPYISRTISEVLFRTPRVGHLNRNPSSPQVISSSDVIQHQFSPTRPGLPTELQWCTAFCVDCRCSLVDAVRKRSGVCGIVGRRVPVGYGYQINV